ncbi:putative Choline dehydrogenase [Glarea lozoyensis 74030]|uniref:Putative Choline dehydrogenase n=1 Tax=Glarea lozoyensis (strain ATCC 74030 / MF5533) TaxID=1104152 RepID=H0EM13_GLAL7|nr:putative Choline dehydrogenase [Glarea lozoyensis 74030]
MHCLAFIIIASCCGILGDARRLPSSAFGVPGVNGTYDYVGIGPAAVLQSHNIPVISDLPGVGENLWDPVFFITTTPVNTSSGSALLFGPQAAKVLEEYLEDGSGPWGAAGGHFSFERIPAHLRSNFTNSTAQALSWFPSDWPEIEYGIAPSPGANAFKRSREFWKTPAARAIKTGPEASPGEVIQTDAQIEEYIKGNLFVWEEETIRKLF